MLLADQSNAELDAEDANFVPQKWAIEAIQRMASGQTLSQMWMHMAVFTLFALILIRRWFGHSSQERRSMTNR